MRATSFPRLFFPQQTAFLLSLLSASAQHPVASTAISPPATLLWGVKNVVIGFVVGSMHWLYQNNRLTFAFDWSVFCCFVSSFIVPNPFQTIDCVSISGHFAQIVNRILLPVCMCACARAQMCTQTFVARSTNASLPSRCTYINSFQMDGCVFHSQSFSNCATKWNVCNPSPCNNYANSCRQSLFGGKTSLCACLHPDSKTSQKDKNGTYSSYSFVFISCRQSIAATKRCSINDSNNYSE